MKKTLVTLVIAIAILASCDPKPAGETPTEPTKEGAATTEASEDKYAKAIELIAGSDCLTCHKVDEKVNGPSYRDVANKYEATDANIEMLSKKVIDGGSGVWGAMAMTPHPSLAPEDAKEMVKYILSLKK